MGVIEATAGDGTVLIEVQPAYGSEQTSVADRLTAHAEQAMKHARSAVLRIAAEMAAAVREMPTDSRPESLSVEFGVSFTAEGNATVVRGGAGASFLFTLTFSTADANTSGHARQ